VTAGELRPTNN